MSNAPPLLESIFQTAYVTNDLDHAAAVFAERYGVGEFYFMRDIQNGDWSMSIALAYAGTMNVELIQPGAVGHPLYADWIAGAKDFTLRHHHYGILVDDKAAWDLRRDRFGVLGCGIPMEGEIPDFMAYLYADTTADLGHYVEYIRLFDGGRQMFAAVPGSPFAS